MNTRFKVSLPLLSLILFMGASAYGTDKYDERHECLNCHGEVKRFYQGNVHGRVLTGKDRDEAGREDCEACHGLSLDHKASAERGESPPASVRTPFRKGPDFDAGSTAACLACHDEGDVSQWRGSLHNLEGMICTDCHVIHGEGAQDGTEICVTCHVEIRARMQRTSHMPLRSGKMACTDCHDPHGSLGPSLLKEASLNEGCYRCHMEMRGPFIWEHAPVRDNCANCHDPHGSNLNTLLKMSLPYLCQSCHATASHSSALYDGGALAGLDKYMVGKGCLNCHPLVHGSNHPSGSSYSR